MFRITSIYEEPRAVSYLYALLVDRGPDESINHKTMPTFKEHEAFIASRPYAGWYLIENDEVVIGEVHVAPDGGIGVALFKRFQGFGIGSLAIPEVMRRHRLPRYFARINPKNIRSARVFMKLGFELCEESPHQLVYERRTEQRAAA